MAMKILKAGLSPVGALLGLNLFGKKKAPAPAPVADTPVMPLPDDQAIAAAKKRSIAQQLQRGGRSSTILTGDSTDLLGG
jgi:hypothetical protein